MTGEQTPAYDPWFHVWLQGGKADGWNWFTLREPPDEVKVMPNPFRKGDWVHVSGPWPMSITYKRQPPVEQFANERIYYPMP